MQRKFICLCRVSRKKQQQKGVGLKAQRTLIETFIRSVNGIILRWFIEVESGIHKERAVVNKILALCRKHNAEIAVSTQSRLSRNAAFICNLLETDVEFTAADKPYATKHDKRQQAVNDQQEWERISTNARNTVMVKRKEGAKLGTNGKKLARYYRQQRSLQNKKMKPIIKKLRRQGMTVREITRYLKRQRVTNFRGGIDWHISTVHGIMRRNGIR